MRLAVIVYYCLGVILLAIKFLCMSRLRLYGVCFSVAIIRVLVGKQLFSFFGRFCLQNDGGFEFAAVTPQITG